jgi:DNA-binding NarL/FixJ family response regulator
MMSNLGRRDHATARIAVVDPLPLFREGVAVVLSAAGHQVETPADLIGWAAECPSALVLLNMADPSHWRLLADLRDVKVIAMIESGSPADGARAVRVGARSVLSRSVTPDALRRAVEATIYGMAVMPAAVSDLLVADSSQPAETFDAARIGWLRKLASGTTVAQLATQTGYSDRAMFRLLAALYREMGVRNRIEAIVQARDRGWI